MEEVKISPYPQIDEAMETLSNNKKKWASVSVERKLQYLEKIRKTLGEIVDDWVKASLRFKGTDPELNENIPHAANEYVSLVPLAVYVNNQIEVYQKMKEEKGEIVIPVPTLEENKTMGKSYYKSFPKTTADGLLQPGLTVEIYLEPGKHTQGKSLKEYKNGAVCVVLGGGNVDVIPPVDAMHKMFVENQVVMMKYNPVNASCGYFVDKLFGELMEDGFFASSADTTNESGAYLVNHKFADTLHLTGSDATYDRIVWGHPSEWQERKKTGNVCNSRYFSCELGCVSPWMIVPGTWNEKRLKHQARNLASAMTFNNGFVCASPKVVVMAEGWEHREKFLEYLQEELKKQPSKPGYYKGAHNRHQTFINKYKDKAIVIKPNNFKPNHLEWVIINNMKPNHGEYGYVTESFSPLVCIVELEGSKSTDQYLQNVSNFCNKNLWGTLSCTMVIPDEEIKSHSELLDKAIDSLEYGSVGINIWAATSYGRGVWGGYPGTGKKEDIQSGVDFVFNPYMFDNPSKTVARSPIISDAHGIKDLGKSQKKVFSRLLHYSINPSTWLLSKLISGALAGL